MSNQLCPKCNGQGTVAKPPWIPGDVHTWNSGSLSPYVCNLCDGRKVIDTVPTAPTGPAEKPWRIGSHYGIHVYEGDRPVATFHRAEDAQRAVNAINGAAPTGPDPRTDAAVGR